MKKYNIRVAPAANDRMAGHFEFLARVSGNAAYKLLDELIEDIKLLGTNPQINPYLDRPYLEPGKYRYKLSYGRYRIIYQIVNDTVYVDDIQDCRQCTAIVNLKGDNHCAVKFSLLPNPEPCPPSSYSLCASASSA